MGIEETINDAFEHIKEITPKNVEGSVKDAVLEAMELLDSGKTRVAFKVDNEWLVNEWLKKAVLLSFRVNENEIVPGLSMSFYDKMPLKYRDSTVDDFIKMAVRIVPYAVVRHSAYIAPNCVLMPSYVNVGAYVDEGTMVDTWATVGSCAQIGKDVHISGGAGIGGVLEPLQAKPTIIEDGCFIGARSEVAEGVIVEEGAVLAMGVFLSQSTKIYDREKDKVILGRVPAYSVVVPGSLPAENGKYSLACAVIVKIVDEQTRKKTGVNELLRNIE